MFWFYSAAKSAGPNPEQVSPVRHGNSSDWKLILFRFSDDQIRQRKWKAVWSEGKERELTELLSQGQSYKLE